MPRSKTDKLISDTFYAAFLGYKFPDASQDEKLTRMPESQRTLYCLKAKDALENETLVAELADWKRRMYMALALQANSELERQGYRQTLLAIQAFEKRLYSLASQHSTKPLQSLSERL
jgi:hypothetical protein